MQEPRKLLKTLLITAMALLIFGSAAQAAYQNKKKITVDHTRVSGIPFGYGYMKKITIDKDRVGGTNTAPPSGFSAVKKITVNNAKVSGSTDLTNFPVLVSIGGDAGLKTTGQGGLVTDSQGDDIIFYDETLTTQLDHEVESYDGTTGTLVAWVRIPTLKATQDTVFYLAYGNSGIGTSQENAAGVWDANYKSVWHLNEDVTDEQTSGTHTDSTSNNNDGSQRGNAVWTSGKIAAAQDFDGNNDYIDLGTGTPYPIDGTAAFTFEAWVYVDTAAGADEHRTVYCIRDAALDAAFSYNIGFYTDAGDTRMVVAGHNGTSWNPNIFSDNHISTQTWVHIAAVYDGSSTVYHYVNGQPDGSGAYTEPGTDTDLRKTIGSLMGTSNYMDGKIDELRISNTNRSADWIKTQYNNQNSPGGFLTIEDSGGLENFPVLVSLTSNDLKSPGRVTSASGHDIIFTDGTLSVQLDHEVESYDPATGTLAAWVRLPELNSDQDTVLYLCYGNSSVTTSQENKPGVWDANYQSVWHLNESVTDEATSGTHADSTANGNDGLQRGNAVLTAGQIAAAQNFDGNDDYIDLGTGPPYPIDGQSAFTFETWVYLDTSPGTDNHFAIWAMTDNPRSATLSFNIGDYALDNRYIKISTYDGSFHDHLSDSQVALGTWTHIGIVYDGISTIHYYINGQSDGSDSFTEPATDTDLIQILGALRGNANFIDGKIDELRVSDINRSINWLKTSYNNHKWPNKADWPTEGFITVTDAVGTDLSNFPVLVSIQDDPQLKTTANNGQVTHANGFDIIFTSDSAGSDQLDHEVEAYDGTSGTLTAWVRLPVLKFDEDTDFYLHYGDDQIDTSQENTAGIWDANYKGVWHLAEDVTDEGSQNAAHADATANNNDGDQRGNAVTTGMIGPGQDFDGANDYITVGDPADGSLDFGTASFTYSMWFKSSDTDAETLGKYSNSPNIGYDIVVGVGGVAGDVAGRIRDDVGDGVDSATWSGTNDSQWHHMAVVVDRTHDVLILYGDGQRIGPDVSIASVGTLSNGHSFQMGQRDYPSSPANYQGQLDEVRISGTSRKPTWLQTNYNNQRWPNKAQWPNEGFLSVERGVCDSAVTVSCNTTTAAALDSPGEWDAYAVAVGTSNWISVYTTGSTDTYGHLYDGDCVEIGQDDTVDDNFYISQSVTAGEIYYVQVRHASGAGTGAYSLVVECSQDDHGDKIENATPVDCNSTVGGSLDPAGEEDYFKVVFWGTGILTAYTTGDNETFGRLLDESGNIIVSDDDSGEGKRFRIERTVSPGVYYVAVKHDKDNKTSDYTLNVECEYTPVITATAEYGGTIEPGGAVGVPYEGSQTFTITPDTGNAIRALWVDGVWKPAQASYTFDDVRMDHKIVAVFDADLENCVDIPDIPLDAWYRSAPANVMFVLDDSGSMDWEFMTVAEDGLFEGYYRYVFDDPGDNLYGRVLPDSRRMRWKSQWAGYNQLYYDPAVDYQPWPNDGDPDDGVPESQLTLAAADPDRPLSHPKHTGTTFDLNGAYYEFAGVGSEIVIDDEDPGFTKSSSGGASGPVYNTNAITIPSSGSANIYPSQITVPSMSGTITKVTVTVTGLSHTWPDDIDMLLVGPGSDPVAVMLMSDQGGSAGINGVNLTFDDAASDDLPWSSRIYSGTYKPRTSTQNDDMGSAPSGSYGKKLSDFNGTDPSGIWELYVRDDTSPDSGSISGGWSLNITTGAGGASGWQEASPEGSQAYNGDYYYTNSNGDYTATWTPTIAAGEGGDYEVYATWVGDDTRSSSVTYRINYDGGFEDVTVDQTQNGTGGVLLGTYAFAEGNAGNVTVSFTHSATSGNFCADSIKFIPAGSATLLTTVKRAHYYVWSESEGKPYLVNLNGDLDYYAVNDANSDDEITQDEFAFVTDHNTLPADVKPARTYAEERQNFANWYKYYRRRELSATAAVANVIAGLKGVQVGFYSINGNLVQPVRAVKTGGTDLSRDLLLSLYGLDIRAQGTPLRRGLKEVGKYYADSSGMIGSSPYATAENGGACQQSFAILMTDGFWNGGNPNLGNTDTNGDGGFDGGGYADIYSNTLADVAMHYYEKDLHSLADNVPTNAADSATHQHMVTYAVSFGVRGSLNPADYDIANGSFPVWPDPRYVDQHKIDDLWHAAVNGRGEFLNAANPTELVESLLAISRNIDARIASSSSVSVNGDPLYHEIGSHTRMYQATYRSDGWTGDVHAYTIDENDDVGSTSAWTDAGSGLPTGAAGRLDAINWDSGRKIATYNGSQGVAFRYDDLTAEQQASLSSDQQVLNYLRGDRSNEEQNGGSFRNRFQVLGDIVHSSPVYNHGVLYAGGTDGMLHAFDADDGDELFAYVPNLVFGHLIALLDPDYSHMYYVDLSPTVKDITIGGQSKTYLVGGLGKGGKGYYGLDVTDAKTIAGESDLAGRVLWEFPAPQAEGAIGFSSLQGIFTKNSVVYGPEGIWPAQFEGTVSDDVLIKPDGSGILFLEDVQGTFQEGEYIWSMDGRAQVNGRLFDPDMGYSYSRPVIARSNDTNEAEWLVIFGNGYDSLKSHAVLYILDLADGRLIKKIDTQAGNCNGLSSPIAIDTDANGTVDYIYAGDLQGNMWKFDLHANDIAAWDVAYKDPDNNPAPVFQALNTSGVPQPITSKPDVMYHCQKNGYLVIFGTGRYLTELDLASQDSFSVYGVWDYGDDQDDSEYLGAFKRTATPQLLNAHLVDVTSRDPVELLEQTIETGTWTTTDGRNLRVLTDNQPYWKVVDDEDDPYQYDDPGSDNAADTVHGGWYLDLPNAGEMVVSDVIIRDGKALVIAFTPGQSPCGSGGSSFFHALDACTGGQPSSNVFVNIDEVVHEPVNGEEATILKDSANWKEPSGIEFTGRLQPPVILRSGNTELNYLSSSTGEVHKQETTARRLGIFYWMQLR